MNDKQTLRKSFKYRCYPNKGTKRRAYHAMRIMGDVWSNATTHRSRAWYAQQDALYKAKQTAGRELTAEERKEVRAKSPIPSFYDQYSLVAFKNHPEYKGRFDAQSLQNVLHKVDGSFKSFYALRNNGQPNAMPPNQKRLHRCLAYRQSGWGPKNASGGLESNILFLSHIGKFRLRLHRPIEGKIKLVSITEKNGKWYVSFSCELEKLSGTCNPVSEVKSNMDNNLRQEYTPSGGDDPEKSGTYNFRHSDAVFASGGDDPEKAGTYNTESSNSCLIAGGDDPEKAGEIEIAFGLRDNIFIIDSAGFIIEHPEFYGNDLGRLERLNQSLSIKTKWHCKDCGKTNEKYRSNKKGKYCIDCQSENITKYCSKNWFKARYTLRKWHEHIENKRDYFLWNLARYYAENFERVTIQKWPLNKEIEYAIDNKTARKLCDGAYGKFVQMLKHKCNELGTEYIERKDLSWQKEIERLTEQAKLEKLLTVLREAKKAVKRKSHARFRYLETALERLTTLRI
ncbi:MAG: hypothetical protein MUP16_07020 [Sedimentisphaerales bacterium]|nr:hypothetical protein [Sedimentisphaerales bacterium]